MLHKNVNTITKIVFTITTLTIDTNNITIHSIPGRNVKSVNFD